MLGLSIRLHYEERDTKLGNIKFVESRLSYHPLGFVLKCREDSIYANR
jgi:hypothetical protein